MRRALAIAMALALAPLWPGGPAVAQAPEEPSAVIAPDCDRECLIGILRAHMAALAARDPSALPLAGDLVFTENNVAIPIGQGLWRTVTGVDETGLEAADPLTGNAAWFGSVRENGEPALYAVRLRVEDRAIRAIESVVHRKTSLPAPFGDWQGMRHFPEFDEVLPEAERRPRERMLAIADAYFDTVELNDGAVFAPFSDDCSRLENGITTTAPQPGEQQSAAAIARGCEAQFRLGLYRINKRIRRQLPLVDVERGVVVASGFFDHANEFDRYLLTDGREMKTALKWPNSITLLEAFRIRDGAIQRIEATFTYVPYFMHNPLWGAGSAPPVFAPDPRACDTACLAGHARAAMGAMVGNRWHTLPWAQRVGYAENSVGLRVGEGIWATVTAIDPDPLVVADAQTGRAVWIGRIEEHGQPAWAAVSVAANAGGIVDMDALIRRTEYGPPFALPDRTPGHPQLPAARRTDRAAMQAAAASFAAALQSNGPAPAMLAADCSWHVNGQQVAARCADAFGGAALAPIETVRDRRLLALDHTRGLAVYRLFEDRPASDGEGYPQTWQVIEVLTFDRGRIARVEAYTSELPYGMQAH